jgi:hypothetical protein
VLVRGFPAALYQDGTQCEAAIDDLSRDSRFGCDFAEVTLLLDNTPESETFNQLKPLRHKAPDDMTVQYAEGSYIDYVYLYLGASYQELSGTALRTFKKTTYLSSFDTTRSAHAHTLDYFLPSSQTVVFT